MGFSVKGTENIIQPLDNTIQSGNLNQKKAAATGITESTPAQLNTTSKNQVNNYQQTPLEKVNSFSFDKKDTKVTTDFLMNVIKNSDLASEYNNPKSRKLMEKIAEECINVGEKENVDPRLLFAIAMQESDCGTNVSHKGGSAHGAMGILSGALKAVLKDKELNSELKGTTLSQLNTDHHKCITVAARYLKISTKELKNQGIKVFANDLAPNNLNGNTWKILSAYRWGAGTASKDIKKDGDIDKGYEKDFRNYLKSLNINIVNG